MALSTVKIPMRTDAPYLSCAQFLSVIAYPHPADGPRRDECAHAFAIRAIYLRGAFEPKWAQSPQPLLPTLFSAGFERAPKIYERDSRLLSRRIICGREILLPMIVEANQRRAILIDGFAPTLENILSKRVLPFLKLRSGSRDTFKSRVWGPSRSVSPAAAAVWIWLRDRAPEGQTINIQTLIELFFRIESLREVLDLTQQCRILAHGLSNIDVRKTHTIRFIGVPETPNECTAVEEQTDEVAN